MGWAGEFRLLKRQMLDRLSLQNGQKQEFPIFCFLFCFCVLGGEGVGLVRICSLLLSFVVVAAAAAAVEVVY